MSWLSGETYKGSPNDVQITNGSGSAYVPGEAIVHGNAKLPGVVMEDIANSGTGFMRIKGMFELTVKGEDGAGDAAIAAFDKLYIDTDGELNADSTNGDYFGIALEAVTSGASTAIDVLVGYPG
jgi:hypothetical protein